MSRPSHRTLPRNIRQIECIKVDKREEFISPVVPCLLLRVSPTGRKTWYFSFRRPGTGKRTKIRIGQFPDIGPKQAESEAIILRTQVDDGLDPSRQKVVDLDIRTFADLAKRYMDLHSKRVKRTWRADDRMLKHDVLPVIGDLLADKLTRSDINAVLDPIDRRGARAQVNRVFALVRAILRWGRERGYVQADPTQGMKLRHRTAPRERTLTPAEIVQFWTGLDEVGLSPMTCAALRLALVTGQRIGEVCGAQRSEFDLIRHRWTIPASRTKNTKVHEVPLSPLAMEIIEEAIIAFGGQQYLFASRPRARTATSNRVETPLCPHSLTTGLRRKLEVLGFAKTPFTPHDFRRTVATLLQREHIREEVVARILNHSSEQAKTVTRSVYMRHDFHDECVLAMNLLSERLTQWLERGGAPAVTPFRRVERDKPRDDPITRADPA